MFLPSPLLPPPNAETKPIILRCAKNQKKFRILYIIQIVCRYDDIIFFWREKVLNTLYKNGNFGKKIVKSFENEFFFVAIVAFCKNDIKYQHLCRRYDAGTLTTPRSFFSANPRSLIMKNSLSRPVFSAFDSRVHLFPIHFKPLTAALDGFFSFCFHSRPPSTRVM